MTDTIAKSLVKHPITWCYIAGGFAVWLAAMAAMVVLPQEHAAAERVGVPTGLLVLHQDHRSLRSVSMREVRPL